MVLSIFSQAHWQMILLNALNAFALNVVIATTLKRLSAVAFVIIGIVKDAGNWGNFLDLEPKMSN